MLETRNLVHKYTNTYTGLEYISFTTKIALTLLMSAVLPKIGFYSKQ